MEPAKLDLMTMSKARLLTTLKANKSKHDELLQIATELYWKTAELKLQKMLERVRQKRKIDNRLNLVLPEDHSADYDLIISMLEYSMETQVQLTPQEFSKFVHNNWTWRQEFLTVTRSLYTTQGIQGPHGPQGAQGAQGAICETDVIEDKLTNF